MESQVVNDYPAANIIKQVEKDNPIIRCEDCHELLSINFNLNKKEIQLICEKEKKTKNIPFETFFESIDKYKELNCCELCKNKNTSQIYYMCKTCSNKILCENCLNEHDKKHDTIKFKIDSTCRKHYNPYESYCPKCKESKCSYCSIDHDESHEKDEVWLKKKLFKKNKLDGFKNNINRINILKIDIEKKINSLVKELEEQIKRINSIKNNFFESLNMQIKFVDLILDNYEKKLKDFDVNYYLINNLENQINFNLTELDYKENYSLDKKIENITTYLNKNLNSQFKFDKDKINQINLIENTEVNNDIVGVNYEKKFECKYKAIGLIDFNEYLFVIYSSSSIHLLSKKNYESTIDIIENQLYRIEVCKKIDNENILVYAPDNILIIKIIDNKDYMIIHRYSFSSTYYDFNSNLDLLYIQNKEDNNFYYGNKSCTFFIQLLNYPNYDSQYSVLATKKGYESKIRFINNDIFFLYSSQTIEVYKITDKKCIMLNSLSLNLNKKVSIIDFNDNFYCLNDGNTILLLNKTNLAIAKSINIDYNNIELLKISNNIITVFAYQRNKLTLQNYNVSMGGIKWSLKETKDLLEGYNMTCEKDSNYIIFTKNNNCYDDGKFMCIIYEIKEKKEG